ncbi:MAG: ankyrin repeat domain-containing protein [Candidatus Krumholzibacteriota bacterium]|nr:ankyrin repeat domain-containing protein [Candidatus Krumholzibacteriota bacterium]
MSHRTRNLAAAGLLACLLAAAMALADQAGDRREAMLEAARAGRLAAVDSLLELDGSLVGVTDERQCTPLHFAADGGHGDVAVRLLAAGADLEARDADGDTPLHWAACLEDPAMVDLLADAGGDVNARNLNNHTPLHYAAVRQKTASAGRLIERGAELEVRGNWGRTPLLHAVRERGYIPMVRLLLDAGADIEAADGGGDTSLSLAAWRGFRTLVDLLLDRGAQLPEPPERGRMQIYAAQRGLERLFDLVVAEDALDVRYGGENGGTMLHLAAFGGSPSIVGTLLDRGLSLHDADCFGWTPLHHAAFRGHAGVAALLLDRGADIDAVSLGGWTPHGLAVDAGRDDAARLLAGRGAAKGKRRMPELRGAWVGQEPPGTTPRLFAPDIVSNQLGQHGCVCFTPDGREAYWSGTTSLPDSGYSDGTILWTRLEKGRWTAPERAPFAVEFGDDVPFVSPDGSRLYFVSDRRPPSGRGGERVWVVEREGKKWGAPRPVSEAVNRMPLHWQVSVSADHTLYFSSRDAIWRSPLVDGVHAEPERVPLAFAGATPFIAPDESYLIFTALRRPGLDGPTDLYIAFADGEGGWHEPVSLGPPVNGGGMEICPIVSHDGKYLFYMSAVGGCEGICWADAGFLDALRP